MHTKNRWLMISMYSAVHFIVDFACAFLMFRSISQSQDWYLCLLVYNFCAFAMQMPIGIIADKMDRNFAFAGVGCILVAVSYGFTAIPLAATVAAGLGNAMFHIGGGVDVLNISEEKSGALGVFISPGAFGIYFGTILGKGGALAVSPALIAPVAAAGLVFAFGMVKRNTFVRNAGFRPEIPRGLLLSAVCLFLVVCLRSYAGLSLSYPWKADGYWGLALVAASVSGKTAGGFLSDRIGPVRAGIFTLGIATVLFMMPGIPAAGAAAVLLFNMSMPVTLWVMAKIIPGAKGFSFGLLTFALFVGFLPAYMGVRAPLQLLSPLAAVSLLLLLAGLSKWKSEIKDRKQVKNAGNPELPPVP